MNRPSKFAVLCLLSALASTAGADGVPPSAWTPQEQAMVTQMRAAYQKQGLPFTDDQAAITIQTMRTKMAQITGQAAAIKASAGMMPALAGGPTAPAAPIQQAQQYQQPPAAAGGVSEDQLRAAFASFPPKSGPVDIQGRRDGFVVNGQPYVDPEGVITSYAFDVVTGNVGYAAQGPAGTVIKLLRAGTTLEPLTIATATPTPAGWQVFTASGKLLTGGGFSVLSDGFLVSRDTAAFRYVPGRGILSIAVPAGYFLAPFQHGNVGATGYVLLEKDYTAVRSNQLTNLVSSFKAIGNEVGLNKKDDYALLNTNSGQLIPLGVDIDSKQVTSMSDCHRLNSVTNKCNRSVSFDSLYDGSAPNYGHYYWRVYWMNTQAGPIAVSLEDGYRHLFITDLNTGKRVLAFSRALGISRFAVSQSGDGTVGIDARVGFDNNSLADAAAFLQQSADYRQAAQVATDTTPSR